MPTTPSPALPDFRSLTPSTPMDVSPAASPSLPGSRKGTPTPELMLPPSTKTQTSAGITLGTMSVKEQGHAISGIIGAGGILTRTLVKPLSGLATASSGPLAVQQQQGGRFVRVMPPLGPITSQAKLADIITSTTVAKSSLNVVTQTSDAIVASSKCSVTEGDKSSALASPNLGSSPPSTTTSPTTKAMNVAEAAVSTSPEKGASLAVRIQEGKLVADVSPTAQPAASTVKSSPVTALPAGLASGNIAANQPTMAQIATSNPVAGQIQGVPKVSQPLAQGVASTLQMTSPPGGKLPVATQPKPGSAGGIKVIPQRTPALSSPSLPIIPNPPPGTQYYITAKSTDPNLQGKVILIPQQVFAQASGQSVLVGSKGGRPGASQIQGKGGAALKPTPATKSSFLSPSNVLILPQGSIVPPLPPGSIVQIQQVPSPSRSAAAASPQQPAQAARPRLAVAQKSASAPALVGAAKPQAPRLAGMPSGGIIQIQRTTGPSATKVFPSQLGGSSMAVASSSGISLLPEKGTLAKTPSGGVVFVQRSPSTGKLNAQPVTGISVAGQSGIPHKVALAAQLAGTGTFKPGSTVSIIQGQGKPVVSSGQTVVLQSPTGLPKLQQVKTIQQALPSRPSQPIILGQSLGVKSQVQPTQGQQAQAGLTSADKGKVQLVSIKQEKLPETLIPSELRLPVGQTPMPLSHEVTITTTDSPSSTPEEETPAPSLQDGKTEPMEVDASPSDLPPKTNESERQLKHEQVVKVEPVSSDQTVSVSPALTKQQSSQPSTVTSVMPSTSMVVPQPTAVVTSHGLVQVVASTAPSVTTTTRPTAAPVQSSSVRTSSPLSTVSPSSAPVLQQTSTSLLRKIQVKQEIVSPPRVASSSIVLSSMPVASSASLVSLTPCPVLTSRAPATTSTILAPRIIAANSTTILKPVPTTSTTQSAASVRPAAPMLLSRSLSTTILGSNHPSSGTLIRPSSTILSSAIPSTILGPSTIGVSGQQTIIVTSALPTQVLGLQKDGGSSVGGGHPEKQQREDPLLVELQRRSREGPVSVYGIDTMEELVRIAAEKTPLILCSRGE